MSISHRIFLVEDDDSIVAISQKTFEDFFHAGKPVLPQRAGEDVTFAIVYCELENRKPKRIINIDTHRLRVDDGGALDQEVNEMSLRLAANRIRTFPIKISKERNLGSVVDAAAKFDQRRWAHLHPKVSGPAFKRILAALFGARYKGNLPRP